VSFPPFIREDPAAVSAATCTYHECKGGSGEARGPISSALLIHKAEAHVAASGHVVKIEVRPAAEAGNG